MSSYVVTARFDPPGLARTHLSRLMQDNRIDALLLTTPENVFYTTGFPALNSSGNPILYALRNVLPFFAYITANGATTLFCWGGAATNIDYGVDEIVTYPDLETGSRLLRSHLSARTARSTRLAVESSCPLSVYRLIADIVDPSLLRDAEPLLMRCRLVKTPQEIDHLRTSAQIVERTVGDLMQQVHTDMLRPTLMRAARKGMMDYGATGIDHITISFGASNPEVEIAEALLPDRLVTLDLGAIYYGYVSDNRRLMFSGTIPAALRDLHETMCGIVDEVGAVLTPGRTFGEMYQTAMASYARHQLTPFIPNIGHTIGLQVEELWIHEAEDPTPLSEGVVLNLEMYALYDTGELIGDEETYVITAKGAERLTNLPRAIAALS
jgi:Xaa-Pro dipeptidase